ncbi:MAG: cytochrome c biogenesis protein CcsA [Magnetococcales bacterium]|nr:cytochrome c biogenesis protein CcsA [Magnetococcales bacterium]MBF0321476.1 cytochrome c biogenesis protein CcsA [Magnetococcales bacterium]
MVDVLFWVSVLAYGVATWIIARGHVREIAEASPTSWWLVATGWTAQALLLAASLFRGGGMLSVDLAHSLSLVALAMGLLFIVGWRIRRNEARSVGLILLPLMLVLLLLSRVIPSRHPVLSDIEDSLLIVHVTLSLLAYGLVTIAAILAMLESFQEHALRQKRFGPMFSMFPPLGVLEDRMFWILRLGMVLLTLSMVTGGFFSHQKWGVYFVFSHKVVLSWATWLVFGVLLYGHGRHGWRGRRAVRFTTAGYSFLVLAYLGVKVVTELILRR